MAANELHVNDIINLDITIKDADGVMNLSSFTTRNLYITKPDDSILTNALLYVIDGIDGKVRYTTVSGDFNQAGLYRYQVFLMNSTRSIYTDIGSFRVWENLV